MPFSALDGTGTRSFPRFSFLVSRPRSGMWHWKRVEKPKAPPTPFKNTNNDMQSGHLWPSGLSSLPAIELNPYIYHHTPRSLLVVVFQRFRSYDISDVDIASLRVTYLRNTHKFLAFCKFSEGFGQCPSTS